MYYVFTGTMPNKNTKFINNIQSPFMFFLLVTTNNLQKWGLIINK